MDSEFIFVCAIQVLVLGLVISAIIIYLWRNLMCRPRVDVTGRTVLITGSDSPLGFELARHYDQLGFRVYAGCFHPAGEAAVRLQAETSGRLHLIPLDVTSTTSLAAAAKLIREQLPASEKGDYPIISLSFRLLLFIIVLSHFPYPSLRCVKNGSASERIRRKYIIFCDVGGRLFIYC